MQQQKTFESAMYLGFIPFLCLVGLLGNGLLLLTLSKNNVFGHTYYNFLSAVAALDLAATLFTLPIVVSRCPVCPFQHAHLTGFFAVFVLIGIQKIFIVSSCWTVLFLAFDLCLHTFNFRRKSVFSKLRVSSPWLLIFLISMISIVETLPTFWYYQLDGMNGLKARTDQESVFNIFIWTDVILTGILYLFFLCALDAFLIWRCRRKVNVLNTSNSSTLTWCCGVGRGRGATNRIHPELTTDYQGQQHEISDIIHPSKRPLKERRKKKKKKQQHQRQPKQKCCVVQQPCSSWSTLTPIHFHSNLNNDYDRHQHSVRTNYKQTSNDTNCNPPQRFKSQSSEFDLQPSIKTRDAKKQQTSPVKNQHQISPISKSQNDQQRPHSKSQDPKSFTSSRCDTPQPYTSTYRDPQPSTSTYLDPQPSTSTYLDPQPSTSTYLDQKPSTSTYLDPKPSTSTYLDPKFSTSTYIDPQPSTSAYIDPQPSTSTHGDHQTFTNNRCDTPHPSKNTYLDPQAFTNNTCKTPPPSTSTNFVEPSLTTRTKHDHRPCTNSAHEQDLQGISSKLSPYLHNTTTRSPKQTTRGTDTRSSSKTPVIKPAQPSPYASPIQNLALNALTMFEFDKEFLTHNCWKRSQAEHHNHDSEETTASIIDDIHADTQSSQSNSSAIAQPFNPATKLHMYYSKDHFRTAVKTVSVMTLVKVLTLGPGLVLQSLVIQYGADQARFSLYQLVTIFLLVVCNAGNVFVHVLLNADLRQACRNTIRYYCCRWQREVHPTNRQRAATGSGILSNASNTPSAGDGGRVFQLSQQHPHDYHNHHNAAVVVEGGADAADCLGTPSNRIPKGSRLQSPRETIEFFREHAELEHHHYYRTTMAEGGRNTLDCLEIPSTSNQTPTQSQLPSPRETIEFFKDHKDMEHNYPYRHDNYHQATIDGRVTITPNKD